MPLYATSITAYNYSTCTVGNRLVAFNAASRHEAIGKAIATAYRLYPATDHWTQHTAIASDFANGGFDEPEQVVGSRGMKPANGSTWDEAVASFGV